MFDNRCKVKSYKFSCDFIKIIEPILDLSNEISRVLIKDYSISKLFKKKFLDHVGVRISESDKEENIKENIKIAINNFLIDESFNTAAEQNILEKNIFIISSKLNYLFFLNKDVKIRNLELDEKIQNTLNKSIYKKNIFNMITVGLEDQDIIELVSKIKGIESGILLNGDTKVEQITDTLTVPFIIKDLVDLQKLDYTDMEMSDLWVNCKLYKSEYDLILKEDCIPKEIRELNSDKIIGLEYDKIIIPFVNFEKYIIRDKIYEYKWHILNNLYSSFENKDCYETELLINFKKKRKDSNLNKLLSFLINNIYICEDEEVYKQYECLLDRFFNKSIFLGGVKNLDNFNFFISGNEIKDNGTALGVYANKKIDGKGFNLQHWYDSNGNKLDHYRNMSKPSSTNKQLVYTLKPEISYYFISKYFEDLMLDICEDLKVDYKSNFRLYKYKESLAEIDFLVKKDNGKLIFIEAKTKLTKFSIEDYVKRCNKLIPELGFLYSIDDISFVLISAYSDDTCEELKYWTKGTGTNREGLKTKQYNFNVPLVKYDNKIIQCIAEPEYNKLKQIVEKICQK